MTKSVDGLDWTMREGHANITILFEGDVNEKFLSSPLINKLKEVSNGKIVLDCGAIRRLNSEGIRRWVDFLRATLKLPNVDEIVYARCSVAVVSQINMIPAMVEDMKVSSVFAPYFCEDTDEEQELLLEVSTLNNPGCPPTFPNENGGVWELDEDPSRYFAFLLDDSTHVVALEH